MRIGESKKHLFADFCESAWERVTVTLREGESRERERAIRFFPTPDDRMFFFQRIYVFWQSQILKKG